MGDGNTGRLIDGKATAAKVREEVAAEVEILKAEGIEPALAVVLVGDDAASAVYVRHKQRACEKTGIKSIKIELPSAVTTDDVLAVVDKLNKDASVHGILVQMPLPPQCDSDAVIERVLPEKDVDGFHPNNLGRLAAGAPRFVACTPFGILRMLKEYDIKTEGANAVIIGRSRIVGRPMGLLLTSENATVTTCHSRTKDLAAECRRADILIAAVGRPELVRGDWVKPGACVIDVGINRNAEGKLIGDVHFEECSKVAAAITPVPGGVGPMTVAMLLKNTVKAAQLTQR
ncbi:MAG TPA: bifunctional methylenetetrahydrofolate dehydrogenase/methenyltetrahydrofolate cyclohydrolase FolD [Myxococcales bacterium]|nr:bifunctional methylenetetrahydrofolate dehydrogenase/methenyltetrahydrofolate cyclohydrolase FolD [Myxococcales bacterium]HIN86561.1 bifunctional methylenetetrahydrofolate dehydrogenase/methenyltetrahydrofolate cyclohydrolase FolD [Myxococcales bacterium]